MHLNKKSNIFFVPEDIPYYIIFVFVIGIDRY